MTAPSSSYHDPRPGGDAAPARFQCPDGCSCTEFTGCSEAVEVSAARVSLPVGSYVIERYVYRSARGKLGVQWLVLVVEKNGQPAMIEACRTRREAAEVIARVCR